MFFARETALEMQSAAQRSYRFKQFAEKLQTTYSSQPPPTDQYKRLEQRCAETDAKLKETTDELASTQDQLTTTTKSIADLEKKIKSAQKRVREAEKREQKVTMDLAISQTHLKKAEQEARHWQTKSDRTEKKLRTSLAQLDALEVEKQQFKKDLEKTRERIEKVTSESCTAMATITAGKDKLLEQAEKKVQERDKRIRELERESENPLGGPEFSFGSNQELTDWYEKVERAFRAAEEEGAKFGLDTPKVRGGEGTGVKDKVATSSRRVETPAKTISTTTMAPIRIPHVSFGTSTGGGGARLVNAGVVLGTSEGSTTGSASSRSSQSTKAWGTIVSPTSSATTSSTSKTTSTAGIRPFLGIKRP